MNEGQREKGPPSKTRLAVTLGERAGSVTGSRAPNAAAHLPGQKPRPHRISFGPRSFVLLRASACRRAPGQGLSGEEKGPKSHTAEEENKHQLTWDMAPSREREQEQVKRERWPGEGGAGPPAVPEEPGRRNGDSRRYTTAHPRHPAAQNSGGRGRRAAAPDMQPRHLRPERGRRTARLLHGLGSVGERSELRTVLAPAQPAEVAAQAAGPLHLPPAQEGRTRASVPTVPAASDAQSAPSGASGTGPPEQATAPNNCTSQDPPGPQRAWEDGCPLHTTTPRSPHTHSTTDRERRPQTTTRPTIHQGLSARGNTHRHIHRRT